MRIQLEKEVRKRKTVDLRVRPALHAFKCDGCGKVFEMDRWNPNDQELGVLHATFETAGVHVVDENGRGLGNMFRAHVCSFQCAHDIFTGGWKKMPDYKPFVENALGRVFTLARAELRITSLVRNEAEIRAEWSKIDDSNESQRVYEVGALIVPR